MKTLLTMLLLASLALATKPDFHTVMYNGVNLDATQSDLYSNGHVIGTQRFIYTEENLPDTIYGTSYSRNSSGEILDSTVYYTTFTYDFDNKTYRREYYYPDFSGDGLKLTFISITIYNDLGLPLTDKTFLESEPSDFALSEYSYNSSNQLVKCATTKKSPRMINPDSTCWVYEMNRLVTCSSFYNPEDAGEFLPLTSVSGYEYRGNKLVEIMTSDYDTAGVKNNERQTTYTLKESPIIKTSKQYSQFDLSLSEGRILHLTNPQKAMVKLYSPSGRELQTLSLTASGYIKEWNSLSNGYYVLRVKQGAQTATLSFVK